jgi:hypothetical protein
MFGCSTEPILHGWTVACTLPVTYLVEVLDTRHCFLHQATKIDIASRCLNFDHSVLTHQTSIKQSTLPVAGQGRIEHIHMQPAGSICSQANHPELQSNMPSVLPKSNLFIVQNLN